MVSSISGTPSGVCRLGGILPRKRGPLRWRRRRTKRRFQLMVFRQQDAKQLRPPCQVVPAVNIRRGQAVALGRPELAAMEPPPLPRLAG